MIPLSTGLTPMSYRTAAERRLVLIGYTVLYCIVPIDVMLVIVDIEDRVLLLSYSSLRTCIRAVGAERG
jgi:hypothetical protein